MIYVEKRDGSIVEFDPKKIASAITKAFQSLSLDTDSSIIDLLVLRSTSDFQSKIVNGKVSVEAIQDSVEKTLSESGYYPVAKSYILYRKQRENVRSIQSSANEYMHLVNSYLDNALSDEDDSSMATFSVGGLILSNSGKITSNYWLSQVYDEQISSMHKNGDFYIHNINMLTGASAGWSLEKLIHNGLMSVNGMVSSLPAKHLSTLCNQIVNFLGIMQNEWASAQSIEHFDTLLAPFVRVDQLPKKMIYDCMESFVYGINIPSRWGTQSPFSQITLDWKVPKEYKDKKAIVDGKKLDFTYGDCEKEMKWIQDALLDVFLKGDLSGRGFQFPILAVYIDENFDFFSEKKLFQLASKFGSPYFLTRHKFGVDGYFGYSASRGSLGTVTLNIPRLAYLSEDENDFYVRLDKVLEVAIRSLQVKRQVLSQFLEAGLYPYTKCYIHSFDDYFGTIGIVGMNEACLNAKWIQKELMDSSAQEFSFRVLDHIQKVLDMQSELYNLEATPAESVCGYLAKLDFDRYPDMVHHGYYTNSSHLDVSSTLDLFEAISLQEKLQNVYSGTTCFPIYLDHAIYDWKMCAKLTQAIVKNFKLPVFTFTPTYSICKDHGYIDGHHTVCPFCEKSVQIWSRTSGYYRALEDWNVFKQLEFKRRKNYGI